MGKHTLKCKLFRNELCNCSTEAWEGLDNDRVYQNSYSQQKVTQKQDRVQMQGSVESMQQREGQDRSRWQSVKQRVCDGKDTEPKERSQSGKMNKESGVPLNCQHHHHPLVIQQQCINWPAERLLQVDVKQSDIDLALYVMSTKTINAAGARIPLNSNWNMKLFRALCTSDSDREVATFLQFGWPLNRLEGPVEKTFTNHMTALKYPRQVWKYLQKEKRMGTLLGPFVTSPFPEYYTGVSPMSTRPKKQSETNRRIIVDLSWPPGGWSVNHLIPKDEYLGNPIKMTFPTVDKLCARAIQLGPIVVGFKKDMQ